MLAEPWHLHLVQLILSFHADHMTGKRSVKEVDKTPTLQPPPVSSVDSTSQKSQGKSALCQHRGSAQKELNISP